MNQKISLSIALFVLGCAAWVLAETKTHTTDSGKHEWVMKHSDDGREFHFRIKGKPEFTDDYSDIRSLASGGSVTIEEKTPALARKLEITPASDGQLQRTYSVNGAPRELDAEGRQWMAAIILDAVRQAGYDAERRVARLFERGGATAVLDEVALIKGDYAKALYLKQLLKGRQLDAAAARRVLQVAARDIDSAYQKQQVLAAMAGKYLDDRETLAEFTAAIGTIDSDHERGQALAALVKERKLTADQMKIILPAVAKMSSDHDKAQALLGLLASGGAEAAAQPAFFQATNGISSAYDRARVLTAVLAAEPNDEALKLVVTSAAGITSDYEKAQVLIAAAKIVKDEDVRKMLVEVARAIRSDYERGNVLSAAIK